MTLIMHGVLSLLHEGERAVALWTATSRSERAFPQDHLPSIEVDEHVWSVVHPLALPTSKAPETPTATTATRMQSCFHLIPRVSGRQVSRRSQQTRLFAKLILPSLRNMIREAGQRMENHFCDELR